MAEDFPQYRHEDSDDDAPEERSAEHAPPPSVAPERPAAPSQQEGTIFTRDAIAPSLSRPLFEFIRKQEQPDAKLEAPKAAAPEAPGALPSVSVPGEPETRTYHPPAEAEMAQAIHEASVEDDDDDDEAADDSHAQSRTATPTPPPAAPQAPHVPELQRPLNEQFEEIMRAEMGEDYADLTSGDRLGETEDAQTVAEEPRRAEAHEPEPPRPFVPEWPTPVIPEVSHDDLEDTETVVADDTAVPAPVAESAFYYTEDEPGDPDDPDATAATTTAAYASAGASSSARPVVVGGGGSTVVPPLSPPTGGGGGGGTPPPNYPPVGGGNFGGGGGGAFPANFNMAPPAAPNLAPAAPIDPFEMFRTPPTARQEKAHKGRWFVAGFITGWVVKQHLANKKMRLQEAAHTKVTEAQGKQIDTLQYNQYHTEQQLKRTENNLQTTQAEQAQTQRAAQAAESARLNQEQRDRFVAAAAAREANRNPMPEQAAANIPLTAAGAEQAFPQPLMQEARPAAPAPASYETPLQYAAAAAEMPFAAAAAGNRPAGAENRPATAPFAGEAAPKPVAEQAPKTPQETAQELVDRAYNLQSGQHIEHATGGGHNIIVDKHGHEVQNAIEYGEEFHAQRRQEQLKVDVFATDNNGQNAAAHDYSDNGIITGLGPSLGSGQIGVSHELPAGQMPVSPRQRLQAGRRDNPVVATVTSPWLWASLLVLLAAFFIAAFI
jgi:hypothetical protein